MTATITQPAPLDLDEVIDLLDEVIEEVGENFTHTQCRYVAKDSLAPVCLVGAVLVQEEIISPVLLSQYNLTRPTNIGPLEQRLTPNALQFLETVQFNADLGRSWAESVEKAKQSWGLS